MRRIVLVLGIAGVLIGAWAIRHDRLQTAACQQQSNYRAGLGPSTSCLNQFSYTWLAFGVLVAGIFTIMFSLLLMRKNRNLKGIKGDRRHHLIGTPGADRALDQHYRDVYGSGAARTARTADTTGGTGADGAVTGPD